MQYSLGSMLPCRTRTFEHRENPQGTGLKINVYRSSIEL